MTRAVLALVLCAAALTLGIVTAVVASKNRARGGDLDRRQHDCETLTRQIELQRAQCARERWLLEQGSTPELNEASIRF